MNICIYGASSAELEQVYYDKTEELGRMMAKRGHGLVFGGGATGMMGAAARGVSCMRTAANLFLQRLCVSVRNFLRNVLMQQS